MEKNTYSQFLCVGSLTALSNSWYKWVVLPWWVWLAGENCDGWKVHWPFWFLPFSIEGILPIGLLISSWDGPGFLYEAWVILATSERWWTIRAYPAWQDDLCLLIEKHSICVSGRQALQHACIACSRKLVLEWVAATDLEEHAKIQVLKRCHCRLLIVLFKL
jgi:hypothetical protein